MIKGSDVAVMGIAEYEVEARKTARYGGSGLYPFVGLVEEVGELAGVLAKADRDNGGELDGERRQRAWAEAGDCAWMLAACAFELDSSLAALVDRSEFAGLGTSRAALQPVANMGIAASVLLREQLLSHRDEQVALHSLMRAFVAWEDVCFALGAFPAWVARANIVKLRDRELRGVIQGEGDNR